jgi:PBP1b-binding outer membrane lipoprotein LpoB
MKNILLILTLFISGCSVEQNINEEEVITLLNNYFNGIDVDNVQSDLFESLITDDYYIFLSWKNNVNA